MVDGKRGVRQTWLAALVGGVAFGGAQFLSSNYFNYQVADIIAALAGALAIVLLLRVWQPAEIVTADEHRGRGSRSDPPDRRRRPAPATGRDRHRRGGAGDVATGPVGKREALLAFAPYLIVVALFTLVSFGPLKDFLETHSGLEVRLARPGRAEQRRKTAVGRHLQLQRVHRGRHGPADRRHPDRGGVPAVASRAFGALVAVIVQLKWTILTVVAVLALAYVMNFSGQTVTLGLALAATGGFFAFLSPVVGWIGVAVTGSDTSANSLFGLLQTTAAAKTGISPYLLAAANTSGGVLGKMISPQNLAIAAVVVGMEHKEHRAVPQGDLVEPRPAAGHVRAGLPAVHPGPRLDGRG